MSDTPAPDAGEATAEAAAHLREERAALEQRITHLTGDMAGLFEASRDSNADDEHDPEGQTIAFERAQLSHVTDRARAQLGEVDAALRRVTEGTYGVCEVCGEPIPPARLEARPTARTCVQHASSTTTR